jgi:hypothetical protein
MLQELFLGLYSHLLRQERRKFYLDKRTKKGNVLGSVGRLETK